MDQKHSDTMIAACKRRKLEAKRHEALLAIRLERSIFEAMLLRAKCNTSDLPACVDDVRTRFAELEPRLAEGTSKEEFDDIVEEAESLSHNRAYSCPPNEIADEGHLRIDVMVEWGVPRVTINQLRQSLGSKITGQDVPTARAALRAILEESDSWSSYFDDYHESMWRYTWWLFGAIILLTPAAMVLAHYPFSMLYALFLAGGVGSCASVVSKVPVPELRLSSEFQGYLPRILGRIVAGTVVSLIAGAVIGWGIPVPIQGETFSTILRSCSAFPRISCTDFEMLFLLGVAMGFGFTERLVAHFEGPWFGQFRRRAGKP